MKIINKVKKVKPTKINRWVIDLFSRYRNYILKFFLRISKAFKIKKLKKYFINFFILAKIFNISIRRDVRLKIWSRENKRLLGLKSINQNLLEKQNFFNKTIDKLQKNKKEFGKELREGIVRADREAIISRKKKLKPLKIFIKKKTIILQTMKQNNYILGDWFRNLWQNAIISYSKLIAKKLAPRKPARKKFTRLLKTKQLDRPVFFIEPGLWKKMGWRAKAKHKLDKSIYIKNQQKIEYNKKVILYRNKKPPTVFEQKKMNTSFYNYIDSVYESYWVGRFINMLSASGEKKKNILFSSKEYIISKI